MWLKEALRDLLNVAKVGDDRAESVMSCEPLRTSAALARSKMEPYRERVSRLEGRRCSCLLSCSVMGMVEAGGMSDGAWEGMWW